MPQIYSGLSSTTLNTPIGPPGKKKILLPMVIKLASSYSRQTGSPVDYEDVVGEGLLGVAKALCDYTSHKKTQFSSYAFLRIRGSVRDIIRREAAKQSNIIVTDPLKFCNLSVTPTFEAAISRRQLFRAVWRTACRELPDDLVQTLALFYLGDFTILRIAQVMQCSAATVNNNKRRAIMLLRVATKRKGITE